MPRPGIVNPLANDTESQVPLPPKEARPQRRAARDDPDAIALKMKDEKRKLTDVAAANQRYRPQRASDNQLYSASGQAAVSPMFGGVVGSGGVGVGAGSPFGNRFGWYADLLRRKVSEKWQTNDVDQRLQTAPPVVLSFDILRDGSVRNIRLLQRSGNLALDYSAQRAVQEAAPFQPLPREFERDSANIEFWFQLKR
jgi:protein TonB